MYVTKKLIYFVSCYSCNYWCFQTAASNNEKSSKGSNKDEIKPKVPIKCKDKVTVINEKANPEDEVNV